MLTRENMQKLYLWNTRTRSNRLVFSMLIRENILSIWFWWNFSYETGQIHLRSLMSFLFLNLWNFTYHKGICIKSMLPDQVDSYRGGRWIWTDIDRFLVWVRTPCLASVKRHVFAERPDERKKRKKRNGGDLCVSVLVWEWLWGPCKV